MSTSQLSKEELIERIEILKENFAQVIKERDEARREICNRTSYPDRTPEIEAKMRGWECYKETNNG